LKVKWVQKTGLGIFCGTVSAAQVLDERGRGGAGAMGVWGGRKGIRVKKKMGVLRSLKTSSGGLEPSGHKVSIHSDTRERPKNSIGSKHG